MTKQTLCQIYVELPSGRLLAVGPKAPREVLEQSVIAINTSIAAGREKVWSNPHLIEVSPTL